jgi:drug/metabolite transporter (DMT)-like permease
MGGFGGTAVLLLIISYRMTEPSNLAPFSYFGIPLIDVFGWLFFNETPSDVFPKSIFNHNLWVNYRLARTQNS